MIAPSDDSTHAIILAGGKSSRMGTDKATLQVGNETLIERLVRILSPHFDGIIISTSSNAPTPKNNLRYVADEQSGCGPLMAIYSCLKASPSSVNFFIACDIPDVNIPLILRLLSYASSHEIIAPSFKKDFSEPLFAVYNRSILPVIEQQLAAGKLKITDCFPLCNTHIVPFNDTGWYRNLNTRDQFEAYTVQQNHYKHE